MNLRPWLGFLFKHGDQLQAEAKSNGPMMIDVATALAPVVKKYKPDWAASGIVDDAVAALRDSLS